MMSREAYFVYERNALRWNPVVYYDEPPRKSVNGNCMPTTTPVKVDLDGPFFSGDGSPNFSRLKEAFPLPDEVSDAYV